MPGGAVPRGEVCKTGEAPARGAARSAAGGRRRRPKAGDAFRGGGDTTRPLDAKPAGGIRHFPRKTSRGTRPARPAGGGTNAFCFSSLVAPAPPGSRNCPFPAPRGGDSLRYHDTIIAHHTCGNFRSRPARVPRNRFPLCNPRAVLEIKDNRLPLHKRPVSTYPFPLTPAFLQPSASGERSDIPRPDLPTQSGRAGYSRRGSAPQGEPFGYLSPRRERYPPRGSAKQTIIAHKKSQVKLHPPRSETNNFCL